jgi:hypothetical protein
MRRVVGIFNPSVPSQGAKNRQLSPSWESGSKKNKYFQLDKNHQHDAIHRRFLQNELLALSKQVSFKLNFSTVTLTNAAPRAPAAGPQQRLLAASLRERR